MTFLPVPLSPVSRMVASLAAAWRAVSSRRVIAGLRDSSSGSSSIASRSSRFFGLQALQLDRALDDELNLL